MSEAAMIHPTLEKFHSCQQTVFGTSLEGLKPEWVGRLAYRVELGAPKASTRSDSEATRVGKEGRSVPPPLVWGLPVHRTSHHGGFLVKGRPPTTRRSGTQPPRRSNAQYKTQQYELHSKSSCLSPGKPPPPPSHAPDKKHSSFQRRLLVAGAVYS